MEEVRRKATFRMVRRAEQKHVSWLMRQECEVLPFGDLTLLLSSIGHLQLRIKAVHSPLGLFPRPVKALNKEGIENERHEVAREDALDGDYL